MVGLGNIDDVYKHYLVVIEENHQLKELLKECRDELKFMYDTYGQAYLKPFDDILLTKITNAIGEKK